MASRRSIKPNLDTARPATRRRGLSRDRDGNASLEMALVAMPLFLFIFAVINAGRALWLQNALENAVMQAARCATVSSTTTCSNASQIAAYAAAQSGAGFDTAIFSFAQASCGNRGLGHLSADRPGAQHVAQFERAGLLSDQSDVRAGDAETSCRQ